jgi:two-component system, cell cycle response regulator DivK
MKCVLLVEDNFDSREIYRQVLEHAGFRVCAVECGGDAIRVARERRPDIILMDIGLPRVNGWEATRILKADAATRSIPVVAITALTSPEDRRRAARIGFEGFLEKPVAPRRVLVEVQGRIGEP